MSVNHTTQIDYYLLLGGSEHLYFFAESEGRKQGDWWWTVPQTAKKGDKALVYLTAPESRIVGRVNLTGEPFLNTANVFGNPKCDGKWMCPIGNVIYYPPRPELTIKGLRSLFAQDWGWVRYPRAATKIPPHVLTPLLELVGSSSG